jgi:hypothetical protein
MQTSESKVSMVTLTSRTDDPAPFLYPFISSVTGLLFNPVDATGKAGTIQSRMHFTRNPQFASTSGGCASSARHSCGFISPDRQRGRHASTLYPATHDLHIRDFPPQNAMFLPTTSKMTRKLFVTTLPKCRKRNSAISCIQGEKSLVHQATSIHTRCTYRCCRCPRGPRGPSPRNIVHLSHSPIHKVTPPKSRSPRRLWPET